MTKLCFIPIRHDKLSFDHINQFLFLCIPILKFQIYNIHFIFFISSYRKPIIQKYHSIRQITILNMQGLSTLNIPIGHHHITICTISKTRGKICMDWVISHVQIRDVGNSIDILTYFIYVCVAQGTGAEDHEWFEEVVVREEVFKICYFLT